MRLQARASARKFVDQNFVGKQRTSEFAWSHCSDGSGAGRVALDCAASSPAQPSALDSETRAEVTRVVLHGVSQAGLDDNDRAYLAQVVSARTGLPPDEAKRRVAMVESKARDAVNEAADKTAKAAAYFSFWTFMSLLFGGVAATLAGILGGQLRDGEGRLAQALITATSERYGGVLCSIWSSRYSSLR
jgi:hypothetical protein